MDAGRSRARVSRRRCDRDSDPRQAASSGAFLDLCDAAVVACARPYEAASSSTTELISRDVGRRRRARGPGRSLAGRGATASRARRHRRVLHAHHRAGRRRRSRTRSLHRRRPCVRHDAPRTLVSTPSGSSSSPPRRARAQGRPVVAIGGITLERAPSVIAAGAAAVAVISDLLSTDDPRGASRPIFRRSHNIAYSHRVISD